MNANLLAWWLMGHHALGRDRELAVVAIGPLHQPHSLDLADGEVGNRARFLALWAGTNQVHRSNPVPIRERDAFAIRLQLPPGHFIFNRTVIMHKAGIAFFARFLLAAVF